MVVAYLDREVWREKNDFASRSCSWIWGVFLVPHLCKTPSWAHDLDLQRMILKSDCC